MKTRELIELLQKADPDGNTEVTIGNSQISYIDRLPAYYDGKMQKILYDKDYVPRIGILCSSGNKIVIHYTSIDDALSNNPFMTIIKDSGEVPPDYEVKWIEHSRSESLKISDDIYVTYRKDQDD